MLHDELVAPMPAESAERALGFRGDLAHGHAGRGFAVNTLVERNFDTDKIVPVRQRLRGLGGVKIDLVLAPRHEGHELRAEYHVVAFSVQSALDSGLDGLGQIREAVGAHIALMKMGPFDFGAHIREEALQVLAGKKSANDSSGGLLELGMAVFEAELIGILLAT